MGKTENNKKTLIDANGGAYILIFLTLLLPTLGCIGSDVVDDKKSEANARKESAEISIKGEQFYDAGDYERALEYSEKAIELYPNNSEAWHNKGQALKKLERYEEALIALNKAIEINGSDSTFWNNKATLFEDLERYNEALEAYDKGILVNPNDSEIWSNKGILLKNLGRNEEALKAYEKSLEIDPKNGIAWNNLAILLLNSKRYNESLEAINKALKSRPVIDKNIFYPVAYTTKGRILMEMGNYTGAVESFDMALKIDPNFEGAQKHREAALQYLNNKTREPTP